MRTGEKTWKFWLPVALTVLGMIIALVQWVRTSQTAVDAQRAVDRAKDEQLASAPALLAQVTPFALDAGTWVFRDDLTPAQAAAIEGELVLDEHRHPDPVRPEFEALAQTSGGTRVNPTYKPNEPNLCVGSTHVKVTLTGNREQKVQLVDVRAKVLAKEKPPRGTLLFGPPQGGGTLDEVYLDLDTSSEPRAEVRGDDGLRPYLDVNFRYLEKGEPLVLDVLAIARDHQYDWELAVDVRYDGKSETVSVRPGGGSSGDPFRTLGWTDEARFGTVYDFDFFNRRFAPRVG
ncbi:hypothetical protein FKR81_39570 [Lentzea tibetensis]|uniref:Uncharacterized protein n=1 Tax=Lentzea tibetensis TaxID=2591470 RepID=A0A563EGP8_9PSEU|nr:hypothetical protein [Lentzea tibetensis]TWP45297.1 hypothetical protein FKR81_39570 [Lentzea tibetensis]